MIAVLLAAICLIPSIKAEASGPPELSAVSAILVDGESGRVLFEKNAHEKRAIASITKLMTALVAAESIESICNEVTIKPEWTGIEGSSLYLKANEIVTVETLLYGLLLHSGNDAAVALAGYCAGDVSAFVARMNARAAELGMERTHFVNPNGLSEEGHYSTAYDMALLGRACAKNELIAKIMATKSIRLENRTFTNHNKLLWRYEGCTGMKTGFTEKSGRTLVSSAKRNGQTLIAVTLNAPNDWNDHEALYDYGFHTYRNNVLCTAGKRICNLPVEKSMIPFVSVQTAWELYYPLKDDEKVSTKISLPELIRAPIMRGEVLGSMCFYLEDELIGEAQLIAGETIQCETVEPLSFMERIKINFFKKK